MKLRSRTTSPTFEFSRRDLGASVVVFLVALPLCMGIAIASGVPVASGLVAGIVGGLVVGMLAGSPLQVSGPAAGLTVLVYEFVQRYGIERLGVIVLLGGLIQIVFGLLRLGMWFRAVSPAVIHGMLAGIGILIFAGQFHVMVDDQPQSAGWRNLITIPQAVAKGFPPPALETAEERAEIRRRMERLNDLHLRQMELVEEVRHALAGVETAEPNGKPDADAAPAAEADALRSLADRQRAIVDELQGMRQAVTPEPLTAAVAETTRALAELEQGRVATARNTLDAAERAVRRVRDTTKHHRWAATLGIITIATLIAWQSLGVRRYPSVPAALVGTIVAATAANLWQVPVQFVEVPAALVEEVFLPNLGELAALVDPMILFTALQLAIVASAETLLCATAVDQLHRGPKTNYDRELIAQGVGNMVCGSLRALPVSGVIVRSSANIGAGAETRWSTVLHGLWILLFVSLFAGLLRMIPTSALAAVLVYTGFKLVNVKTLKRLWRQSRFEAAVFVGTALGIVGAGLLAGVLFGLGLAIVKLLYEFSHLEMEWEPTDEPNKAILRLKGNCTFLTLPRLASELERLAPDTELHLNVEYVDYIDHACRDLLHAWERENESLGGRLVIDRESLAARFWRRPRQRSAVRDDVPMIRARRERQVPI